MNDPKYLEQVLSLLKSSYTCTNSSKLMEVSNLLNNLSKDEITHIDVLLHGLSISSFNNEQIPSQLHESLAVNLKNTITGKKCDLDIKQIIEILKRIFELYFPQVVNPNLLKDSIINIFQYIIRYILSNKSFHEIKDQDMANDCENFFKILLNMINKEYSNGADFIINSKIVIKFIRSIFESKFINNDNFVKIINDYYIGILDVVFKNVPRFIDPEKNLFCDQYIKILDQLIEDMYLNLKDVLNIHSLDYVKYNEIFSAIFNKYGKLVVELIKIQLPLDEKSKNVFINQNPIISFTLTDNENIYCNLNTMKSKCFQYLSYSLERLSVKIKENSLTSYVLNDLNYIELFASLIKLVISSLEDLLSSKDKYTLIKTSKEGIFSSDTNYNYLLYHIFLFLSRCLIRNPIKQEFSSHIKYFLLNILFPLATFEDSEKLFMIDDPNTYINYINDILYDFKHRNFRTSLCFLIKRLCDNYEDCNIILNYVIEMIEYILDSNNNNIKKDEMAYSTYLKNENKSIINNFNDEIKIDFCFLMILLLKSNIIKHPSILNKFMLFFISNQDKIHQINSDVIKIKICEIYEKYISYFFNRTKPKSNEDEEVKLKIKNVFIENMVNFLFSLVINTNKQNIQNSQGNNEALVTKASDVIINILKFINEVNISDNNKGIIMNHLEAAISEKIRNSFKNLVELINIYSDNISFINVMINIINNININNRQDIFLCLNTFTNKFLSIVLNKNNISNVSADNESQNKAVFINQYFTIIKDLLTGENRLKSNEIKDFNDIILPLIDFIKEPTKYTFCDEIIEIGEYYIKCINNIDIISMKILENMYPIISNEKTISGYYYSFISTFLSFINLYNIDMCSNYINIILNIIKLAYSFENKENRNDENVLYTSLLTIQILSFQNSLINNDDIKLLISENLKLCVVYFQLIRDDNDYIDDEFFLKDKIQQVLLCNFSIYFMLYSEIFINILINDFMNMLNGKSKINNLCDLMYTLYSEIFNIDELYYPLLGKCNIICLCSIFSNDKISDIILNDIYKKKKLFRLLFNLVIKNKSEKRRYNLKLTDGAMRCEFIECEEKEENSNSEENAFDNTFNEEIIISIKNYENIIKCDEFKLFSETFFSIKNKDENSLNELLKEYNNEENKLLYNLLYVRNVQVEYNGNRFEIPRRTLKIKRNIN